jgi:hypothetical protein
MVTHSDIIGQNQHTPQVKNTEKRSADRKVCHK